MCPFILFPLAIVLSVLLPYIRILMASLVSSNSSDHIMLHRVLLARAGCELTTLVVMITD